MNLIKEGSFGYLLTMSDKSLYFIKKENYKEEDGFVSDSGENIYEVLMIPKSQTDVSIVFRKASEMMFEAKEVHLNINHIVSILEISRNSKFGKGFLEATTGIKIVSSIK